MAVATQYWWQKLFPATEEIEEEVYAPGEHWKSKDWQELVPSYGLKDYEELRLKKLYSKAMGVSTTAYAKKWAEWSKDTSELTPAELGLPDKPNTIGKYYTGKEEWTTEDIAKFVKTDAKLLTDPEVLGRYRELKYRTEYLWSDKSKAWKSTSERGPKGVSDADLLKWASEDVEKQRQGLDIKRIEFERAEESPATSMSPADIKEYGGYQQERKTTQHITKLSAKYSQREKKEFEEKIAQGKYEQVPETYYDYLKYYHPVFSPGTDYEAMANKGYRYLRTINADRMYLESLPEDKRQKALEFKEKQWNQIEATKPIVDNSIEEYWNWLADLKATAEPEVPILSSTNKRQLENLFNSEGQEYLDRIKKLRDTAPPQYAAAPILESIEKDAVNRVTTVSYQAAMLEYQSELVMSKEKEWADSDYQGSLVAYLKEKYPDIHSSLDVEFIKALDKAYTKVTPEEYNRQLFNLYFEHQVAEIAKERGVSPDDDFAMDAIRTSVRVHKDAYDKIEPYIDLDGYVDMQGVMDGLGEDEGQSVLRILGVAQEERKEGVEVTVRQDLGVVMNTTPMMTLPGVLEVEQPKVTIAWWQKPLEVLGSVIDRIDAHMFVWKAGLLLDKETRGESLSTEEREYLDKAEQEMPASFKQLKATAGLSWAQKLIKQPFPTIQAFKELPVTAKEVYTPSEELRYLFHEATPWWQELGMSVINPIWYISGGGALKGTSSALQSIRAYRAARVVERAGVAVAAAENLPFKPIQLAAKKIGEARTLKTLKKLFGAFDDETRRAVENIRAKQLAGQKLTKDEKAIANVIGDRWDKLLATPKGAVEAKGEKASKGKVLLDRNPDLQGARLEVDVADIDHIVKNADGSTFVTSEGSVMVRLKDGGRAYISQDNARRLAPVIEPKGVPKPTSTTPVLDDLQKMWATKEAKVPITTRISAVRLALEERITDKFAGWNKFSATARRQYKKEFGEIMPLEMDAEYMIALATGSPVSGKQYAEETINAVRKALGKDIDAEFVNAYATLRHQAEVLNMLGPGRKVPGLKSADDIARGIEEIASTLGKERFQKVEAAAKVISDFYNDGLLRMAKSEVIDEKLAKELIKKYPWYNPIKYIEEGVAPGVLKGGVKRPAKSLTIPQAINRLSQYGLDAATERPLYTLAKTAVYRETLIAKNDAARAMVALSKYDDQLKALIKKATATTPEVRKLSLFEGGKRVTYEVPEYLAREASYLSLTPTGELEKIGLAILWASRMGMTGMNLAFFIPNLAFDTMAAIFRSGILPHDVGISLYHSFNSLLRHDSVVAGLRKSGGAIAGFMGRGKSEREIVREVTRQAEKSGGTVLKSTDMRKILLAPFDFISSIGEAVEMTPRLAILRRETIRGTKQGLPDAFKRAAVAARRNTIDFQRSGTLVKQMNNFYLYFNAGVQGSVLPFRALRDSPRARLMLAGYFGLTATNYAWNRQFPEYEQVSDFVKYQAAVMMLPSEEYDDFGNKKPNYLAFIPNLREFALFSAPIIYMLRRLDEKDTESVTEFLQTLLPIVNPISQVAGTSSGFAVPTPFLSTWVDISRNWDDFRSRPIVPEYLQTEPVEEQYNQYTSRGAIELGRVFHRSPMMVEYFIEGFLGGVGGQFLDAADWVLRRVKPIETDPRIMGLYGQLAQIKETTESTKYWIARRDFLYSLSKEDRDRVIELEREPEPRIPIITTIMKRLHRTYGDQVWQRAQAEAKKALEVENTTKEERREEGLSLIWNSLQAGNITVYEYNEQRSQILAEYAGASDESWERSVWLGAISRVDTMKFLPEGFDSPLEMVALYGYWEKQAALIEQAGGELTGEKWGEIQVALKEWLNNNFPRDVVDAVNRHKHDWVADMPESVRKWEEFRYNAYEEIDASGYYDMPSGNRARFLEDPANARIAALIAVMTGKKPVTIEAEAMIAHLLVQTGLNVNSIYGDDVDPMLQKFKWDIPLVDIYHEDKRHDDAKEAGTESEFLVENPHRDAVRCFMGSGLKTLVSYPYTEEGWIILEDLWAMNGMTSRDRYGALVTEYWDDLKYYRLHDDPTERLAYRAYGSSKGFDEMLKEMGFVSKLTSEQRLSADVRLKAKARGWIS